MTTGFATHGEVLRFLYNAFGVLPRKEARHEAFTDKDKKTLQQQLTRLASEEGNLVDNYKNGVAAFCELIAKYFPARGHASATVAMIHDLDGVYADMVRNEGTYLDKSTSLQYFISIKAVPAFVWVLNRSTILGGLLKEGGVRQHDPFWYLPSREPDGRLTMPLAKVMDWTYAKCGTSQKQFHCPGKASDPTSPAHENNLENAIKWKRGKIVPSMPALAAAFTESFSVQRDHGRAIDDEHQADILTALAYGRIATFIAREIREAYGDAYLDDLCSQIRLLTLYLDDEMREFLKEVAPVMEKRMPNDLSWARWHTACAHHADFIWEKITSVEAILFEALEREDGGPFDPEMLAFLKKKFGNYAVHFTVDRLERQARFKVPEGFAELHGEGMQLKTEIAATLDEIDDFERRVIDAGLQDALSWIPAWLRGVYHYRREEFASAFQHYKIAYDLAKYRAGDRQYKLVNQFIELSAKNDKKVSFKNGIDWATYIGLEVRWLRDKEATEENLEFVRYMMKRANYSHQL